MPRRVSRDCHGTVLRRGDTVRSRTSGRLLTVLATDGDEIVVLGGWRKPAVLVERIEPNRQSAK